MNDLISKRIKGDKDSPVLSRILNSNDGSVEGEDFNLTMDSKKTKGSNKKKKPARDGKVIEKSKFGLKSD